MISWRDLRALVALVLGAALAASPAHALITLNDGHDRIHVTGSFSVSRDTNIFASAGGAGDYVYNSSLGVAYARRAGWIKVDASMGFSAGHYGTFRSEDFNNPSFGLELSKQSGRTTGAFTMSAARESRADAAANLRTTSWNTPVGLNFKYPISGTYALSGSLGYSSRRYEEASVLASLSTYSSSINLFHVVSSERDVNVGYRYRYSETSHDTSSTDHGINVGLSGKLIRGVNGSLSVGYQVRKPTGPGASGQYSSWTANGSSSYAFSKKFTIGFGVGKDFSTTATDSSVDVTSANLDAQYAYSSRLSTGASIGFVNSRFLGDSGRLVLFPGPPPVLGPNREDTSLSFSWSVGYAMSEHLRLSFSYGWSRNWSMSEFADFDRASYSLSATSSW